MAAQISLSLGEYRAAISDADSAAALRQGMKDDAGIANDYKTVGLGHLYLGNYAPALSNFERALKVDLARRNGDGEIACQNNIGNVYYFQGRYWEALRWYQAAMERVNATAGESWNPRRRRLTTANLAVLYQRLGQEQTALQLYRQMSASPADLPASEQAQLLLNQGSLYRRLGDPIKALEVYQAAQAMFAQATTGTAKSEPGGISESPEPSIWMTCRARSRRSRRRCGWLRNRPTAAGSPRRSSTSPKSCAACIDSTKPGKLPTRRSRRPSLWAWSRNSGKLSTPWAG